MSETSSRIFNSEATVADLDAEAKRSGFVSGEQMLRNFGNHAVTEFVGTDDTTPESVDAILDLARASGDSRACVVRIEECDQLLRKLYDKTLIDPRAEADSAENHL